MNQHKSKTSNAISCPRPSMPVAAPAADAAAPERDLVRVEEVHDREPNLLPQVQGLYAAAVANAPPLAFEFPRLGHRTKPHRFPHPLKHGSARRWLIPREIEALIDELGIERMDRILGITERE